MESIENLLEKVNQLKESQNFEKALNILEGLFKKYPKNQIISLKLIELLFSYGMYLNDEFNTDYEKAIKCFKRIISIDKENYRGFYNLGLAYFNIKYYEEALKQFNIALKIKPDYKYCLYNIGLTYETIKKYNDALIYYEKALNIDDSFRYALHAKNQVKEILKLKKKQQETIRELSFFKSEDLRQKFIDLIKISNRLQITTLIELLKTNTIEFYDFIVRLGEKKFIQIDGDFIVINRDKVNDLIEFTQNL